MPAEKSMALETELNEAKAQALDLESKGNRLYDDYQLLRQQLTTALKERDEAFTKGMKKAAEICVKRSEKNKTCPDLCRCDDGNHCAGEILSAIAELENPTT